MSKGTTYNLVVAKGLSKQLIISQLQSGEQKKVSSDIASSYYDLVVLVNKRLLGFGVRDKEKMRVKRKQKRKENVSNTEK